MRITVLIFLICFAPFSVICQLPDASQQIEQVQIAAGTLVSKGHRAEIMLRDLTELEGTIVALMEDSFSLRFKGISGKRITAKVAYKDVLVIRSKEVSISFIPDQTLLKYGTWDDILKISYNHNLEVILENGQIVPGRSGEITKDNLTLVENNTNTKISILRDQIIYIYLVRDGYRKTADGTVGGVNSGAKIGRKVGEVIGITPSAKVFDTALGTLIGAGIGAISGASKKEIKLRVLIYSK